MAEQERHHPEAGGEGGDDKKLTTEGREWTVKDIREIVSPDYLLGVSKASGGFQFIIDDSVGPEDPMGRTDMKTRLIKLNPYGIKELSPEALEGLLVHEAGHHAPEVFSLDQKMVAHLGREGVLPEEIADTPEEKVRVLAAINGHLCNGLLDCWDESFMSRRGYVRNRQAIETFYVSNKEKRAGVDLRQLPKPDQLVQLLVGEDRYPRKGAEIKDLVDSDVYQVYRRLKRDGAIDEMNSVRAWDHYFATSVQHEQALLRKLGAFRAAFLPAWLELFQAESEKRQEEIKKQGQGQGKGGELTEEQIKQILKELAEILQELGEQQYGSKIPAPEKGEGIKNVIAGILKDKEDKKGKGKEEPSVGPEEGIGIAGKFFLRELGEARRRGMAENMGIRIESVRTWQEIKEQRAREIEYAAAQIADVFLEDRRRRIEYMRREGEIVPGLEYEYVAAVLSGDASPQTHMKQVQNPEFLETEVEFIQDVSGSMNGEPIRKCIELQIILAEAFKKVRETLDGEQLLHPREEEPLRIGVTKFETRAKRVKKLTQPMDDKAELTIVDELTKGGGGTDEKEALEEVYGQLTLDKKNILKIMVILTDGQGNKEAVANIMGQIEQDQEVIVAAVGLGSHAKEVVQAYSAGLRKGNESNVYTFEKEDPAGLLPDLLDFFRKRIQERRRYL